MMTFGTIKMIGIGASIVGAGATLVSNWVESKKLDQRIDQRIDERLSELQNNENEEEN